MSAYDYRNPYADNESPLHLASDYSIILSRDAADVTAQRSG